jgi:hypothetical protein
LILNAAAVQRDGTFTWQSVSRDAALANVDSAEKLQENLKPVVAHYVRRTFSIWTKRHFFYNAQPKMAAAINGEDCGGRESIKTEGLSCCAAKQMTAKIFVHLLSALLKNHVDRKV